MRIMTFEELENAFESSPQLDAACYQAENWRQLLNLMPNFPLYTARTKLAGIATQCRLPPRGG